VLNISNVLTDGVSAMVGLPLAPTAPTRTLAAQHAVRTPAVGCRDLYVVASPQVDDSFNKCFTSTRPEPWNWNFYLFPFWVGGVVLR
jgi:hypothetical protein